jgi:DNA-binding NarL/FixJ family response regulator
LTRTFIVASMRLYREAVTSLLAGTGCVDVVATHSGGPLTAAAIAESNPDVVLLDMSASDSYDVARAVTQLHPHLPLVAMGVGNSEAAWLQCAEVGIIGCVPHDAPAGEVVQVIERAIRGETLCSPRLAGELVRKLAALARDRVAEPARGQLTRREREVVALIEEDCSNKEIAVRLGIEVATVKNHVHNLLDKLGVSRRAEISRVLQVSRTVRVGSVTQHPDRRTSRAS